ncbi:MAG TPA: NrfD/PsrC family molybdoenzyme membrane anchor subunit [Gammaproteobacteria bacterium]|nr:NrfD/PsrC family molybdoenzyme membrane anchor subunit [Gammaproteobacteria bacterium]
MTNKTDKTKQPLLDHKLTHASMTDRLTAIVFTDKAPWSWLAGFLFFGFLTLVFLYSISYVFKTGVGVFGLNIPVAWELAIVNTIWWIGIAHAGTLISGVLLLTRQNWRPSIARFSEAMAMFAIIFAGSYPLIHLGRPWLFYYLMPYPNTQGLWPNWKSPLVWDFFAITTYLLYTMMFLYLSLLPDLATMRDQAKGRIKQLFYGVMAIGWRGSARHWARYDRTTMIFAAISAPIVVSVTGTISLDLAVTIVPGYHFTIFPPYFVSGALYSGFATVVLIAVPFRSMFKLHNYITPRHFDYIGRVMLGFVLVVDYAYMCEIWTAFYSGADYYRGVYWNRWFGPYMMIYWSMYFCNIVLPQLLWFKKVRRSVPAIFGLALVADIGMWLERYIIVVTSTNRDYMPSAWRVVWPTGWDWAVYIGSLGAFCLLMLLFVRIMPPISLHDMRKLIIRKKADVETTQ